MLDKVVLPAPFSPSSACTSPFRSSSVTRRRAGTASNDLLTSVTVTAGSPTVTVNGPSSATSLASPAATESATNAGDALDCPVDEVRALVVDGLAVREALRARGVDQRPGVGV